MDSLLIKGGTPLHGEVKISGAKNAVLPIMAATLLTGETCVIRRVPDLSDVGFMAKILSSLGAQVTLKTATGSRIGESQSCRTYCANKNEPRGPRQRKRPHQVWGRVGDFLEGSAAATLCGKHLRRL